MKMEDWGDEQRFSWRKIILVVLIISVAVGTVFAVYKITSPDSDPVTVSTPATLSKPIVNGTSVVTGDTIQVSTVLSDAMNGVQVFFYENDVNIGFAYTGSGGIAIINRVVNTPGTYVYHADCVHP